MEVNEIISSILEILKGDNEEYDGNIYSFKYMPNNSVFNTPSPSYTLTGYSTIKKYNDLYNELYKKIVGNKKISLKVFKEITQNLIFEKNFNEKKIKELIGSKTEKIIYKVQKIYGLKLSDRSFVNYGKFTIVKKQYMHTYLCSHYLFKNDESIDQNLDYILNESLDDKNGIFVYVICKYSVIDSKYADDLMKKDMEFFIWLIRFLIFNISGRQYVDIKRINRYIIDSYSCNDDGFLGHSFELIYKDIPISIDPEFFYCDELLKKIWNIVSKESPTNFENRIIQAIRWIGMSLETSDVNLIVAEIAFAFETILFNTEKAFITKGVSADLAETYAFINGKTRDERLELESQFKKFYDSRSSVCHGARVTKKNDYKIGDYYMMIYNTMKVLLTDELYESCKSCDNLYEIIKNMKYA